MKLYEFILYEFQCFALDSKQGLVILAENYL